MQKVKNFFLHNRLLLGICGVIILLALVKIWGWTLEMSASRQESIKNLLEREKYLEDTDKDIGQEYVAEYREEGHV